MFKNQTIIGLEELDIKNSDLFVRKSCTNLDKNSQVIVEETHCAILIKDGEMIDTLLPGKHSIFEKGDKSVSKVDIIYMSKTAKLKSFWGTINRLTVKDYSSGQIIEICANGEYEIQIKDPRKFYIEVVGAEKTINIDNLKERLQGRILSELEPLVAKTIKEQKLSYEDLIEEKSEISKQIFPILSNIFEREYGLSLFSFNISKIFIPKEYANKVDNIEDANDIGENIVCANCGQQNSKIAKFCSECGNKLN